MKLLKTQDLKIQKKLTFGKKKLNLSFLAFLSCAILSTFEKVL